MTQPRPLRLIAESAEDLGILASAVRDSVVKAENIRFQARQQRFSLEINRFRWEKPASQREPAERVRALLAFEGVRSVKTRAISKADPELILSLLQISWTPASEPPAGKITLLFAGDGELELTAEMLEVTLMDSDYVWPTRHRPDHERRKGK